MTLILDLHTLDMKFWRGGLFKVSLGNELEAPFDLSAQEIELFTGQETRLRIEAVQRITSKAFMVLNTQLHQLFTIGIFRICHWEM